MHCRLAYSFETVSRLLSLLPNSLGTKRLRYESPRIRRAWLQKG